MLFSRFILNTLFTLVAVMFVYIDMSLIPDTKMEKFRADICKVSKNDTVFLNTSYAECTMECRSRSMCESISVYTSSNLCYLHFDSETLTKRCYRYVFSEKSSWLQKSAPGCEETECQVHEKCKVAGGLAACINSTGVKLGREYQPPVDEPRIRMGHPDYTSVWTLMEAHNTNLSKRVFQHNLGEVPALVEVLVTPVDGPYKGFLLKATGSASRDDDSDYPFGGVVYIYNDVTVLVTVPQQNNGPAGFAIHTGVDERWTGGSFYQSMKAYVKVRCWLPSNMPAPCFQSNDLNVQAGENHSLPTYFEIDHGADKLPDLVLLRTKMTDGRYVNWYSDGQGTDSFDTTRYQRYTAFSGVKFGFDDQTVRIWIPTDERMGERLVDAADGWGAGFVSSTGIVDVRVWCEIRSPVHVNRQINVGPGQDGSQMTLNFNSGQSSSLYLDYFASVLVQSSDGPNRGYLFHGVDSGTYWRASGGIPCTYGGLIYSYNNNAINLRRPSTGEGAIVCISHMNSHGNNTGATINGIVHFKLWTFDKPQPTSTEKDFQLFQSDSGSSYPDIGTVRQTLMGGMNGDLLKTKKRR